MAHTSRSVATALLLLVGTAHAQTLENFGAAAHEWNELNDPVMGGKSVATFGISNKVGVFNGTCAKRASFK